MIAPAAFLRGLGSDQGGVSILEFAIALPVLITLGLYGTEVANMAVTDMQVAQIATSVADNASRLEQTNNSSSSPSVTSADVAAVMSGATVAGSAIDISGRGRIILSSLEMNSSKLQYIHWQRCSGSLTTASKYGTASANGTTTISGMGVTGHMITANSGSAVMFVEVTYHYKPLFSTVFVGDPYFRHEAAYIIRDDRDLTVVPIATTATTC